MSVNNVAILDVTNFPASFNFSCSSLSNTNFLFVIYANVTPAIQETILATWSCKLLSGFKNVYTYIICC